MNFLEKKLLYFRLPAEAVNSASVDQFKIELDKVIDTLILFIYLEHLLFTIHL